MTGHGRPGGRHPRKMPDGPSHHEHAAGQAGRTPHPGRTILANRPGDVEEIRDRLLQAIAQAGYPEAAAFAIRLAFDEAVANAFKHGHASLEGDEPIEVLLDVRSDEVRIVVTDRGPGFDPEDVPDPTLDENLSRPSGRGIMLMRAYMTDVRFNERGNEVTLVYRTDED